MRDDYDAFEIVTNVELLKTPRRKKPGRAISERKEDNARDYNAGKKRQSQSARESNDASDLFAGERRRREANEGGKSSERGDSRQKRRKRSGGGTSREERRTVTRP